MVVGVVHFRIRLVLEFFNAKNLRRFLKKKMKKIRVGDFRIGEEEKKVVMEVMESGRISEGEKVREFEEKFANYIGTKDAVLVNSGTSALIASLMAMIYNGDIEEGSSVVTTPLTYIATSNAIRIAGLNPLYVDVDRETFGITPDAIETSIEGIFGLGISAILPVHLMGYACDMNQIKRIADGYGLKVIEDAAQAHGSVYGEKKLGSFGDLGAFSFFIAHNIQVGEMGAVVSDDYELLKLVKQIKANGRECSCPVCGRAEGKCVRNTVVDPRFNHRFVGFNFKTMEFQAALGLLQLEKADEIMKKRRENVIYLNEGLMDCRDELQLPLDYAGVSHIAYPIVIKNGIRQVIMRNLEKKGVEVRPLFGCIPTQQPAYEKYKNIYKGRLPNAEWLGRQGFYVGCHQYLEREELDYIIKMIKEVLGR